MKGAKNNIDLAIRPSQLSDESTIGFALRTASNNGFQYISRMLSVTALNKLIRGTGIKLNDTFEIIDQRLSVEHIVNSRLFQQSWQVSCKICLNCVQESGYIKAEVQNPFVACCSTHKTVFIDKCGTCNEPLKWDINLLKGLCTSDCCGANLTDNQMQSSIESKLSLLSQQQIADCFLASYLLNALDKTIIEPTKFCTISDYYEQIKSGYNLLTNSEKFTKWLTQHFEKQSSLLPINFLNTKLWLLIDNLSTSWPIDTVVENIDALHFHRKQIPIEPLVVSLKAANVLLETNTASLRKLNNLNLIKVQSNTRMSVYSKLDVSPIIKMLSQHTVAQEMQSLASMKNVCLEHTIELIDIMEAVLKGDFLLGYKPSKTLLHSIHCMEIDLINLGEKVLASKKYNEIRLEQATHVTGYSLEELIIFRKKGMLRQPVAFADYCFMSDVLILKSQNIRT